MILNNSISSEVDLDTQRRKALARVYELLIKIADELEEASATSALEEIALGPASSNPVPLKLNIPSEV